MTASRFIDKRDSELVEQTELVSQLIAFICLSFSQLFERERKDHSIKVIGEHLRVGLRKNGGLSPRIWDKIRGSVIIAGDLYNESVGYSIV